jgi:hypothetical protein
VDAAPTLSIPPPASVGALWQATVGYDAADQRKVAPVVLLALAAIAGVALAARTILRRAGAADPGAHPAARTGVARELDLALAWIDDLGVDVDDHRPVTTIVADLRRLDPPRADALDRLVWLRYAEAFSGEPTPDALAEAAALREQITGPTT